MGNTMVAGALPLCIVRSSAAMVLNRGQMGVPQRRISPAYVISEMIKKNLNIY